MKCCTSCWVLPSWLLARDLSPRVVPVYAIPYFDLKSCLAVIQASHYTPVFVAVLVVADGVALFDRSRSRSLSHVAPTRTSLPEEGTVKVRIVHSRVHCVACHPSGYYRQTFHSYASHVEGHSSAVLLVYAFIGIVLSITTGLSCATIDATNHFSYPHLVTERF